MSSAAGSRPAFTNRLIEATSPYLLQHAHNPVDWWPWCDDAIAEARRRNVPIFLSIGYSTCYWCHVMERESFESETIAEQMNADFVCIKLDREERPDLDDIYMAATQTMTGRGGWPMSVFLEPDTLRPFFCGTYYPAEAQPKFGNMPTFPQVLGGLARAYAEQRDEVREQAEKLTEAVQEQLAAERAPVALGADQVQDATQALLRMHDQTHGGFGGAPKFPQPTYLEFLLDVRDAGDDATTSAIDRSIRVTLDRMLAGGIHDHVGGGFHRYAVDNIWLVPHFEKMLYDNGQLASVYARAAELYDDADYRRTLRRLVTYVQQEMTHEHGAFFSAQDAEVNGREGLNYLWLPDEINEVLGEQDGNMASRTFGLELGTNFQDPHHPDEPARNVIRLADVPSRLASMMGLETREFEGWLNSVCDRLYDAREKREQPRLDDKILTAWNGLMIRGLADAAGALSDRSLLEPARAAADFILQHMRTADGVLCRSWRKGKQGEPGFLEDYGHFIAALVAVARSGQRLGVDHDDLLAEASKLAADADRLFATGDGGFFDAREGQGDLFVRARTTCDGAIPTGQSAMLHALLDLAESTGEPKHRERALELLRSLSGTISAGSLAAVNSTRGLLRLLRDPQTRDAAAAFGPVPAERISLPDDFTGVEVFADRDRVTLGPDQPAEINLKVTVADGYHLISADPTDEGTSSALIPLRAHLVRGSGVAVYADYPEGEPLATDDEGLALVRVHHGSFELRVALELDADADIKAASAALVGLTVQVCTDSACLPPRTLELDVAIDVTS
ncbi:MAG: DUF255 domain-containing protein [Planctomycetota bacterium]